MIERLQHTLERIEGLPELAQERAADLLERFIERYEMPAGSLAGLKSGEQPDTGEPLLRWQHERIPTLPLDEHLPWLDMGPDE